MKHISLFSGIGGFDLASERMGWTNVASCEINPFCRRVLEYYWPNAYHHNDIHTLTIEKLNDEITKRYGENWRSDDVILTGGFPCQPYSQAGKRLGTSDERHLWPEMLRIIREVQPKWIVGENVLGLVNWSEGLVFEEVCADLEAEGYEVQPYVLPAAGVDAPHQRYRVWFVAYLDKCTTRPPRKSGSIEDDWCVNYDEQEQWRGTPEQHTRSHNVLRSSPNSENTRQQTCTTRQGQIQFRGRNKPMGQDNGKGSQLNPLFVAEMMGFPALWTLMPFLEKSELNTQESQRLDMLSGGTNQSKDTETP